MVVALVVVDPVAPVVVGVVVQADRTSMVNKSRAITFIPVFFIDFMAPFVRQIRFAFMFMNDVP